jgi:signal transduction histidine kinase
LQQRARQLAISNRELERFASVVAHDLRAPLRHMSQFVDFLARECADGGSPKARTYIEIVRNSAGSMSNMVERLLDYARIGVGALRRETISLADCIAHAAEVVRPECPEATFGVDVAMAERVVGDPVLIDRLFLNLLQNALKFVRPEVRPEIDVTSQADGDWAVIAVTDNGPGVPPDKAEDIFKMFTRLSADNESRGYGMGLAICRRICETQRGTIVLDKTYDKAARFVIRLPRAPRDVNGGGAA